MRGLSAVVPIAGHGTRMRPWSYACSKAFLPVLQRASTGTLVVRSALDILITDALTPETAIDSVCLVVSPAQKDDARRAVRSLGEGLASRVRLCIQYEARGLGHAVLAAKDFLPSDKPFVVALGDHVFSAAGSTTGGSGCFKAMTAAWAELPEGCGLTAVGTCASDEVQANGLLSAEAAPVRTGSSIAKLAVVTSMVEKPDPENSDLSRYLAPLNHSTGQPRYTCNFGIDIMPWETMAILEEHSRAEDNRRTKGHQPREVGLRESQAVLQKRGRLYACNMEPGFFRHDLGNPVAYWAGLQHFASAAGEPLLR